MDPELTRFRGTHVAHSLSMLAELPHYVDDEAFPVGLRAAAIDAFFVHLRLIIQFLIKNRDARAIRRHDYASNFHMDSALRGRLNDDYDFASRYVVHLNVERVPTDQAPTVEYVDAWA